jgi:prophage DNA circulation protein
MRKAIVLLVAAVLLVPLLLVAAGCGEESTEDAKKQLCEDLQGLQTALVGLTDISLESSVDDLQANQKAVEDAWNKVVDSASKVADAQINDLKDAVNGLVDTIENIPSGTTISEALELITAQLSQVESAWAELTSSLNCEELMNE